MPTGWPGVGQAGGPGAATTSGVYRAGTYWRTSSIGTGRRSAVSKQSFSSVKISPACSSILTPSVVIGDAGEATANENSAVSARTAALATARRDDLVFNLIAGSSCASVIGRDHGPHQWVCEERTRKMSRLVRMVSRQWPPCANPLNPDQASQSFFDRHD